jgi:cytochrome P450
MTAMANETSSSDTSSPPLIEGFDVSTWPALVTDHWNEWDRLRSTTPLFRAAFGPDPIWVITEYAHQHEALQDYGLFSSSNVTVQEPAGMHQWIPEELDPPVHGKYRQLMTGHFTPGAVKDLEPRIRTWCAELIDSFVAEGQCDFINDFARLFPTIIFMGIAGLPVERAQEMLDLVGRLMHTPQSEDPDGAIRGGAVGAIMALLNGVLDERVADPRDDVITTIATATIEGTPVSRDEQLQMAFLLYMAGLDTVAGELGAFFHHLAACPADRQFVLDHPDQIPTVVEELLRAYSIVITGRVVTRDVDWHGCPMHAGDRILVPTASGNRDPGEFERAAEIVFDRERNRHMAFGAGPHRCLGSYLARSELTIALEEWHKRVPEYRLAPSVEVTFHSSGVCGFDSLPLVWDVAR